MTPKEKAKEILLSYKYILNDARIAKRCALIAVDEIIPIVESYEDALSASQKSDELVHWQQVKQEIQKL